MEGSTPRIALVLKILAEIARKNFAKNGPSRATNR